MRHEIVAANTDIEARFYLSVDEGSFVTPHWHNSLEMVYMLEGSMEVSWENHRTQVHPERRTGGTGENEGNFSGNAANL